MARSGHTLIIEGGKEGVGKVDLAEEPAFSSSPSSLGPHSWPPPSRSAQPHLFPGRQQPPPDEPLPGAGGEC